MEPRWIGGIVGLLLALPCVAQVQFKINGGTAANLPSSGIISVGTITSDTLVHVFDSTGVDEDAPAIIVEGSSSGGANVFVQVTSTMSSVFGQEPTTEIVVGLRDLGGLSFFNPNNSSDTSLRDHAVVAVAIQGDVTGNIDAAQIFRVDALRNSAGTSGGLIQGDITAHKLDGSVVSGRLAVAYVRAGFGITGDITAAGDATLANPSPANNDPTNFASIGRVVVGPSTNAVGIQGDVLAKFGAIESIFTTGPIGRSAADSGGENIVSIIAGDGIREVRAIDENDSGVSDVVVDANFNMNLLANSLWVDPVTFERTDDFPQRGPSVDGTLGLIATAGDLNGEVRASNIICPALSTGSVACNLSGIYVRGICRAPITIDY